MVLAVSDDRDPRGSPCGSRRVARPAGGDGTGRRGTGQNGGLPAASAGAGRDSASNPPRRTRTASAAVAGNAAVRRRREDHPDRLDADRSRRRPAALTAARDGDRRAWAATSARRSRTARATTSTRRSRTASRSTAGRMPSTSCAGSGTEVGEQTDAVEVTGQIVDLEARIRNLKASETALSATSQKADPGRGRPRDRVPADGRPRPDRAADRPEAQPRGPGRLRDARPSRSGRGRGHRGRRRRTGIREARSRRPARAWSAFLQALATAGHLVRDRVAADPARLRDRRWPDPTRREAAGLAAPADPARPDATAAAGRRRGLTAPLRGRGDAPAWHDSADDRPGANATTGSRRATTAGGRRSSPRGPSMRSSCWSRPSRAGARDLLDIGDRDGRRSRSPRFAAGRTSVSSGSTPRARWPLAAEREADRLLAPADRGRFETRVAFADELPFEDGAFDVAMSSFVFQLVPNRARALREARRVLRPGGTLGYVTWLDDDRRVRAGLDLDDAARRGRHRVRASPAAGTATCRPSRTAVEQLRRAGFRDVTADASRAGAPVHDRRLRRVHDRVRRGRHVRVAGAGRARDVRAVAPASAWRGGSRDDLVLRLPVVAARGVRTLTESGASPRPRPRTRSRRPAASPSAAASPSSPSAASPSSPSATTGTSSTSTRGAWTLATTSSGSVSSVTSDGIARSRTWIVASKSTSALDRVLDRLRAGGPAAP